MIKKENNNNKIRREKILFFIGLSFIIATCNILGQYGVAQLSNSLGLGNTSHEILDKSWIRDTYGSYGLSVETPERLTKSELTLPDNIKEVIDQMDTYNDTKDKGFSLVINSIKYKPTVGEVNLKGSAQGSINEMRSSRGISNFDYIENYVYKNDIHGFIQKGTYKINNI